MGVVINVTCAPMLQRDLGKGIALFAGGAIGDHAHGVERFLRPSRRDNNFLTGKRSVLPKKDANVADDVRCLEHAPYTGESRSEMPLRWTDEDRPPLFQHLDIFLRCGVIVHAAIHSGRDQKRRARRQRRDRQQAIRLTVSQLGNRIRRARRNDEQVGGVPESYM